MKIETSYSINFIIFLFEKRNNNYKNEQKPI